jgi:hypothetical protein
VTDIVERLVTLAACGAFSSGDKAIMLMAADAIEERDAEIVRLRDELRIATDVLLRVIVQACQRDDQSIDSGFIGSYADGIRWLAHYGLIELDGESSEGVYRRVAHGMLNANGETRLDNSEPFVGWTPYPPTD